MKKTIATLAVFSALASGAAMAAESSATANFQWAGVIPALEVSNGIEIRQAGSTAFNDGILEFSNKAEGIRLVDSSVIAFDVVKVADKTTVPSYSYTLENMRVSNGGITNDYNKSYFAIGVNGVAQKVGFTGNVTSTGKPTNLNVMTQKDGVAPADEGLKAGQNVLVQALVSVNATI
ncbi:hypothetical protein PUN50_17715 [Vibrio campbellii]|uniref:Uncharacterized protein n=1 Tax=Vibrio campbellii TaxID=680 RepID=A0AAQ2Y2Z6_9VIBR|nr:hypothetical protein [Vibrio campbellii]WDG11103.1 hypothetical protein PUN50_17715 [Vibrio campbellii]